MRLVAVACFTALVAAACEPTPNYLRRWANTDGSEQRYLGYLKNSELSHEVRVTALELLVEQWDHSYSMLASGGTLKDLPDAATRDAILTDATPRIRELYEGGGAMRHKMRDAAYHLRQGTSNPAARAGLDAIIVDWVNNHWDPCQQGVGVVRVIELLRVAGAAAAQERVLTVIRDGAFDRLLCFGRDVSGVEWIDQSDEIAQAYVARWESGNMSENQQLRFEFLEQLLRSIKNPSMRTWAFERLVDEELDPLYKNAILDAVSDSPTDEDIEGYARLLTNESYARWAAFQAIVNARGSDGLDLVLSQLPATGEYGFYDGHVRADGLKRVTSQFLCTLTKLTELGDNARVIFERHMRSENIYAKLIAISCLARYGDAQSAQRLNAYRDELGRALIPAPSFGEGATLQGVIDETIAAIQSR